MSDESRPYHHGDLRSALIEAGLVLARRGGIQGLGLREVARSVGVAPTAVYRHFADRRALVLAVAGETQERLAEVMRERMRSIPDDASRRDRAHERLRAVGLGYIEFALTEPGWFELAFLTRDEHPADPPSVTVESRVPPPFQLLLDALDDMLEAGVLSADERAGAEWACWSTVHGFADIATRGPLNGQDRGLIDLLAAQVVDTVIAGLVRGA